MRADPRAWLHILGVAFALAMPGGALAQQPASAVLGTFDGRGTNTIVAPDGSSHALPTRPGRFVIAPAATGEGVSLTMSSPDGSDACSFVGTRRGVVVTVTAGSSCTAREGAVMTVTSGHATATGAHLAVELSMTVLVREAGASTRASMHYEFAGQRR